MFLVELVRVVYRGQHLGVLLTRVVGKVVDTNWAFGVYSNSFRVVLRVVSCRVGSVQCRTAQNWSNR